MNKICLIHHPIGIGDIFYLQYIARIYLQKGFQVIWPIRKDISWIKDYIPDINFCLPEDQFPGKEYYGQDLIIHSPGFVYLGLKNAHMWNNIDQHIMGSKYSLMNLDWNLWNDVLSFRYFSSPGFCLMSCRAVRRKAIVCLRPSTSSRPVQDSASRR